MTALRRRMIESMQLRGLSPGTQKTYLRVIYSLAQYFNLPPDQLTPDQLRQYFLYLRNEGLNERRSFFAPTCHTCVFSAPAAHIWPFLPNSSPDVSTISWF
jgi:hypothetical protein